MPLACTRLVLASCHQQGGVHSLCTPVKDLICSLLSWCDLTPPLLHPSACPLPPATGDYSHCAVLTTGGAVAVSAVSAYCASHVDGYIPAILRCCLLRGKFSHYSLKQSRERGERRNMQ